ncbi:hypothetical protein H0G86_006410 [Trichoderma simmonsii]|uniref:F-box domain-containing protein n=1 Tax=Trichoderma simmonsii TaxID=1491479 RepID=A0A8G0LDF8_9HYPO|nr:hypothetical protein H0G86_006410 [Trichoderma simmonsii]
MRCLRFLRRLLGKGRHHHRDYDENPPSAVILQLPLDLLLLITDQLALHDKFLLSHTCKTLRQVTCQDWAIEVSRLSFEDQIGFWAGLAYTLPNHWACLKCCQLHPIDTSDVPRAYWAISARDDSCTVDMSRGVEIEAYSVQHYHVQFALKLSRLGNIHRRYLKALMKPYTCTRKSHIPPLRESYTAEPRIINKRFILREEWKFSNNTRSAISIFPDEHDLFPSVCPHMDMMYGGPARSRLRKESSIHQMGMRQLEEHVLLKEVTLLEQGIASACEFPGRWIFNSCLHCATDIAVMISIDGREGIIRAWHDFGIEGSPMDISWKAHVRDQHAYWLDLGPYLDYPHGSIRESWLEGASHGTGTGQSTLRSVFKKPIE